ncbi:MAG: hypothetical protein U5O39_00375 [Gammaproteobacteria bacterium]|nr:hypothetical protein [Gammaproteobacteria bacterium]
MAATQTIESAIQALSANLGKAQSDIDELLGQISRLEALPLSADEAEQWLRTQLTARVRSYDKFTEAMAHGREINVWRNPFLAEGCTHVEEGAGEGARAKEIKGDMLPVLVSLFDETILDTMVPLVRQFAEDNGGIPTDEREKLLDKDRKKLRKLEEQEEAIITEAELNDVWTLRRRQKFDPALVLGVEQ